MYCTILFSCEVGTVRNSDTREWKKHMYIASKVSLHFTCCSDIRDFEMQMHVFDNDLYTITQTQMPTATKLFPLAHTSLPPKPHPLPTLPIIQHPSPPCPLVHLARKRRRPRINIARRNRPVDICKNHSSALSLFPPLPSIPPLQTY
jgi:hypothetical protein